MYCFFYDLYGNCDIFDFNPIIEFHHNQGMADVLVAFFNSTLNPFFAVNLKEFLLPISNIQGKYVTLSQAMYRKLVLWENILSFRDNRVRKLLTHALEYLPLLLI